VVLLDELVVVSFDELLEELLEEELQFYIQFIAYIEMSWISLRHESFFNPKIIVKLKSLLLWTIYPYIKLSVSNAKVRLILVGV